MRLTGLLLVVALLLPGPLAAQSPDPAAIVRSIYGKSDPYGAAASLTMRAPKRPALSKALGRLWKRSDDATPAEDEPVPGFDIASNSQDTDMTSADVTVERQDAAHATVAAALRYDHPVAGDPRRHVVRYDFVRENGRWKIDDVRSFIAPKEWSIKRTLSESLKR